AALPDGPLALPAAVEPADFDHPLDEAYIRGFQTWIDDAGFDVKWADMMTSPISLLGGADSAFHADLASRAAALPGGEVLCHGDAKLDNFGWTLADGAGVFGDNDFDDGGLCPAAADALHYLLATDLWFDDPDLDTVALDAYIAVLESDSNVVAVDPTTQPDWDTLLDDGVAKDTKKDAIALGGEVQAATSDEVSAITALVAGDPRFPSTLLDVAQDLRTTGGSAGLRRFWLLVEDATHPETIIELKELTIPGTEFGPHSATYDGPNRFDVLKPYWWSTADLGDHFTVYVLGSRFLARDKYTRTSVDPTTLTAAQVQNAIQAEASMLAHKHRAAWAGYDPEAVRAWLSASAQTLIGRWRAAFTAGGGT
ncbi:MAG TPA: DUF2252 family protein, partial [Kofleriaceae bacterium]|nr:DUF2252 family protein [Kofleriaceae bacterium]